MKRCDTVASRWPAAFVNLTRPQRLDRIAGRSIFHDDAFPISECLV
jgi:hypothetical protein